MTQERFRCALIGETSLLVQCAEVLLRRGHSVSAVVSPEDSIRDWADRSGISHLAPGPGLAESLARESFDYLFSAGNLSILPDEVLALPRLGAVNFHDGPLPRYAGLNATSWALIHREPAHAVTWHEMTMDVDAGDILKQRSVEISPDETALSLNTACLQAGIQTFEELIQELEEGRVQPRAQDRRDPRYFGRFERPDAACVISWSQPAEEIDALVRALQFGPYRNPLGLPKLLHEDRVFYLPRIRVLDSESTRPPGSVVSIDAGALVVSTGTRDVEISELLDSAGRRAPAADGVASLGLRPGDRFTELDPEARDRLTRLNGQICRHERYWTRRLSRLEDLKNPYAESIPVRASATPYASASIPIPDALDAGVVPAAFALYLARLSETYRFHIAYRTEALRDQIAGFESILATHVPIEIEVDPSSDLASQLEAIQTRFVAAETHRTYSRDLIRREPGLQSLADDPRGAPLSVTVERIRDPELVAPPPGSDFTLVVSEDASECRWFFDPDAYPAANLSRMQLQFSRFLLEIAADPSRVVEQYSLVTEEEHRLLEEWKAPSRDYDRAGCIHQAFEERAASSPDRVAVIFEAEEISYGELNSRANQLASFLRGAGVGPDVLVGVFMERSIDMMVGLLGILKAGGAYLPLDPSYPAERVEFMMADADIGVLVTQSSLIGRLPAHHARTVRVDGDRNLISRESDQNPDSGVTGENLGYVIYTSGSTGQPKGVMVRHRNVVNFFLGIDACIPHDPPGVWLAVTTLSFDISVLELFWTLTRGFRVVVSGEQRAREPASSDEGATSSGIDFSLFYFSSDAQEDVAAGKYELLLEGAKFGDERGFSAVWTPERHFHAFGGLYPNPSVTSAAIAATTERIAIRGGSCVLPLHHPIRVAEEWAVVDNLSNGRVGIAVASGWQPNDFVLRPENFENAKDVMFRDIETVRKLWRGEALRLVSPKGDEFEARTLPRPVQADLPVWITTAGNPETFRNAGARGFNLLTHLVGQTFEELAEKIAVYREARAAARHSGSGHVTLMLHTFVGDSGDEVRETVRGPMREYLRSAVGLVQKAAWTFPTQKRRVSGSTDMTLSEEDMDALLEHAFDRYYETSGLFGTPEECLDVVNKMRSIGVDEIGCLIDFGVESSKVLAHLEHLARLKDLASSMLPADDFSIPAQIVRHRVTHIQCTPSLAGTLLADPRTREALRRIDAFLVGGEALPPALAGELTRQVAGDVFNMYGPTEATIWSTVQKLGKGEQHVAIGRPLRNQQAYVVDSHSCPAPIGVAGELLIGGDGVTAGYLNRPELTRERFTPIALASDPTSPVYRTGDLVRYRDDGTLEFVGRVDDQVKIRGHRIEPGEIEAALNAHPGIGQSVVAAREDVEGNRRLVAYYVPEGAAELSVNELRSHLEGKLPEYMTPSAFVAVEAFPLTPAGKIDRRALPAPAPERPNLDERFAAPTTPMQKEIAELWESLLGIEEIGVHDDFFDLGGDSLLVVHFVSGIQERLGIEVRIGKVFESPTVEALAEHIEGVRLLSGDFEEDLKDVGHEREQIHI